MAAIAATVASAGPLALVIAFTALASAAGSAEKPAAMALLPRLVGEVLLGPANALLHTVQALGVVIGPAIGAILLAVAPAWVAFAANGATFAVSALLISAIRPDRAPAGGRTSGVAQLAEGLRTVRTTAFALWLIVVMAMAEFTYGAQTVQLVAYATHSLGLGSGGYGVLLTAAGAGGLVSAVVNGRLATGRRVSLIVIVAGSLACATGLAYAGVQVLTIALAVTVIGNTGLVSLPGGRRDRTGADRPREALGRVIGTFLPCRGPRSSLAPVLASVLVASTSLRASLLILGTAAMLITAPVWSWPARTRCARTRSAPTRSRSRVKVLQGLPVTVGVPQIVLEQLAAAAQFCPLPPGVDVVVQGAPAHAFYAVADGRVVVHRDGRAVVHLGPGDSFGERGLLDRAPETPPSPRKWTRRCSAWKATRCSTPSRRRQACGPRWISAAPRPVYKSRRARPRWWTTRAGQRHDPRRARWPRRDAVTAVMENPGALAGPLLAASPSRRCRCSSSPSRHAPTPGRDEARTELTCLVIAQTRQRARCATGSRACGTRCSGAARPSSGSETERRRSPGSTGPAPPAARRASPVKSAARRRQQPGVWPCPRSRPAPQPRP